MKTEEAEALYYPVQVLVGGACFFLLWKSATIDSYVSDETGRLLAWDSQRILQEFAHRHGIHLQSSDTVLSLDDLEAFVGLKAGFDAERALNFWNFFNDLESTHPDSAFQEIDGRSSDLYNQLFSMTSSGRIVGEAPTPLTIADSGRLREVMRVGQSLVLPLIARSLRNCEE